MTSQAVPVPAMAAMIATPASNNAVSSKAAGSTYEIRCGQISASPRQAICRRLASGASTKPAMANRKSVAKSGEGRRHIRAKGERVVATAVVMSRLNDGTGLQADAVDVGSAHQLSKPTLSTSVAAVFFCSAILAIGIASGVILP